MRNVKYAVLAALLISMLMIGISVGRRQQEFKRLLAGFEKIDKNASQESVLSLMGMPDSESENPSTAFIFWDDEVLSQNNSAIKTEFRYRTFQFFLPKIFVVGFDEKQMIISKHLMD